MIRTASPTVLENASDVKALLSEAENARVLVLSRREAVRAEGPLVDVLRALDRREETRPGKGTQEILGDAPINDLGHAPFWIDAGSVYEDLVAQGADCADVVLCLDPWAAQLITDEDAGSGARWYIVSDLSSRKPASHGEYWAQLEEWFERRPFAGIIAREAWEEALGSEQGGSQDDRVASVHLHRPGAWQWRKITGSPEQTSAEQQALHFLVKYSGSLPHLRVFLDSLARQDYPRDLLRATIVASEKSEDLRRYLRWHALAHPALAVDSVVASELDRSLEPFPGALVVLTGDHTILPPRFAQVALEMAAAEGRPALTGIPLSDEASAHVLTGNLDAVAHYESMVGSFARGPNAPSAEAVRMVPPKSWMGGDLSPLTNIMAYIRASDDAARRSDGPGLLCLGDLE